MSTAKDTWEIKVVPQLNHKLFFTSAMKSAFQMNGRWKKNGIEIKLFTRGHDNFRFDRNHSVQYEIVAKVRRIVGRAHSMIEKGRKIPIQK